MYFSDVVFKRQRPAYFYGNAHITFGYFLCGKWTFLEWIQPLGPTSTEYLRETWVYLVKYFGLPEDRLRMDDQDWGSGTAP